MYVGTRFATISYSFTAGLDKPTRRGEFHFDLDNGWQCPSCHKVTDSPTPDCDCTVDDAGEQPVTLDHVECVVCPICRSINDIYRFEHLDYLIPADTFLQHLDEEHFQ